MPLRLSILTILSGLALLACCSRPAEQSKPNHQPRLSQLQDLQRKHVARRQNYVQSFKAATSDEERASLVAEFSAYWKQAVDQMLAIAERAPSTNVGLRAALWVVDSWDSDEEPHIRATELLLEHHALAEELGPAARNLSGDHPVYEHILRVMAASNASASARGSATFELAELLMQRATYKEMMDVTPELQADRIKNLGAEIASALDSTDPTTDRAEAKRLYLVVQGEFPDVPYRDHTLREAAAERLMPLEQTYPEIGKSAPRTVGRDLDGSALSLEMFRGKVVVLTFWASWCAACLERVPEENRLVEELRDANFVLLGVNGDESLEAAHGAAVEQGIQFVSWWDDPAAPSTIVRQWGVTAWPTTFVLDETGTIRYKNLHGQELRRCVKRLLASDGGVSAAPQDRKQR